MSRIIVNYLVGLFQLIIFLVACINFTMPPFLYYIQNMRQDCGFPFDSAQYSLYFAVLLLWHWVGFLFYKF